MKHFAALICFVMAGCAMQKPLSMPAPTQKAEALPTPITPLTELSEYLVGPVPRNDKATVDLFTRSFDELVFTVEGGGRNDYVRKWNETPIQYRFHKSVPVEVRVETAKAGNFLHNLVGIEFEQASRVRGHIQITSEASRNRRGEVCAFYPLHSEQMKNGFIRLTPHFTQDGTLRSATVIVTPGLQKEYDITFAQCMIEEMSQLLGLQNDSDIVENSLWRNALEDKAKRLTYHDAIILRTLYDFRIKPGMPRAQALPIARRIIGELLAELNS